MLEFNQPTFIIDTYKENEHSNSIKKLILKKNFRGTWIR